jgi:signal peptidase II
VAEDARLFDLRTPVRRTARPRRTLHRLATSLLVAASVVVADQITKSLAVGYLTEEPDQSVSLVGNLARLTYVENRGAAFGILQEHTLIFVVVGLAVIGVIMASYRYFPVTGPTLHVALGLQLGGAIGNLADRVRLGYVVDFVDLAIWPVFNVADSAIVVGVAMLAFYLLRTPEPVRGRRFG